MDLTLLGPFLFTNLTINYLMYILARNSGLPLYVLSRFGGFLFTRKG